MTEFVASYVSGVSDVPLLGHTIGEALERATETWPEQPALIARTQSVRWTWRELRSEERRVGKEC